jgi:2-dehydro-3-deoxygluconokinase
MKRIALLGECLIELNGTPFGTLHQTFGGDSLNTALYLARLIRETVQINYVSAVGTDTLSGGMLQRWATEGIATDMVLRDPVRLPGMYLIQVDATGERTFLYWREQSAARYLLQHPEFTHVAAQLTNVDMILVTGISLAILPPEDRTKLIQLLTRLAASGVTVAFDTNYRARLWSSANEARAAANSLLPAAHLVFATLDDEQQLWGDVTPQDTVARLHAAQAKFVVVKVGADGCLFSDGKSLSKVPTSPAHNVVDTTAAGDSFNAGFLAGWLAGHEPYACCHAGNALAGVVIQHRGAIMPMSATPSLIELLKA